MVYETEFSRLGSRRLPQRCDVCLTVRPGSETVTAFYHIALSGGIPPVSPHNSLLVARQQPSQQVNIPHTTLADAISRPHTGHNVRRLDQELVLVQVDQELVLVQVLAVH